MRFHKVTPCVGVWIETHLIAMNLNGTFVTPCVGVWIETDKGVDAIKEAKSHPAWVCGLKQSKKKKYTPHKSHTLRGCVD